MFIYGLDYRGECGIVLRKTTMTKEREMEILDGAITTLGSDSYLGPWLSQVRGELERDIRSDVFPTVTLAGARLTCERLVAETKVGLELMQKDAERMLADARTKSDCALDGATSALRDALRRLTE